MILKARYIWALLFNKAFWLLKDNVYIINQHCKKLMLQNKII